MSSSKKQKKLNRINILNIVTGSIAAYKAADLVSDLREQGARVTCVMTEGAKKFATPLVLRAVSGERVYDEFFSVDTEYDVLHTSLAEDTDLILVSPASADFIARVANGLADDLASCIMLAARKPVVVVPAMNDQMFQHPITQKNIEVLRAMGYIFVEPIKGPLVCGKEAVGHIAEAGEIVTAVEKSLCPTKKKKVK